MPTGVQYLIHKIIPVAGIAIINYFEVFIHCAKMRILLTAIATSPQDLLKSFSKNAVDCVTS
jgi:hypothetical protein